MYLSILIKLGVYDISADEFTLVADCREICNQGAWVAWSFRRCRNKSYQIKINLHYLFSIYYKLLIYHNIYVCLTSKQDRVYTSKF